ncbi:ABC transporter substrate-binding protein [Youhaiella tibetensis]|uniref:Amino acid ABC transporter substrate-binding protein n=1 Tax=Paradevosia tibetensis TaxID=1447062 RepID=A0A5B9DS57_9HYPH|nr:transporter substrate-binding domain-containing protein [Youhaiella tibetensis]QEE21775.1 amino acid ABC transporter substrate-binding protein [Youhaiella tibetensis]GGF48367.1 ABC transporter substrate-binding protein [Youhaiella tibetensis]
MSGPDDIDRPTGLQRVFGSRLWRDLLIVAVIVAPLSLVYLLPTDTSLAEVQRRGVLTACVPTSYPPLVMEGNDPGFDIRMLEEIARRLGVALQLNVNPAIGQDFNPRNWRVNRAQCEILGGGVVVSAQTRSFLETISTDVQTGWALVSRNGPDLPRGARVGIFPGTGGLDRVALSALMRQNGIAVSLLPSAAALEAAIASGAVDAGITESLGARGIARTHPDWTVAWLPAPSARYALGYGLWKGDLMLKRRLAAILGDLEREGFVSDLETQYGILPIETTAALGGEAKAP